MSCARFQGFIELVSYLTVFERYCVMCICTCFFSDCVRLLQTVYVMHFRPEDLVICCFVARHLLQDYL